MSTVQWFLRICTVIGLASIFTAILLAGCFLIRPRQGFPKTRQRRWLR